jgi:HAD superfamily hydrolase (TIGR01509 family)
MMAEAGLPITAEIFRGDFLGRSFASAAQRTEQRFGRPLPAGFQLSYRDRLLSRMSTELRPMEGVFAMLDGLRLPYCLATSSSPPRLELSLRVTGLAPYFEGRAFTASEVKNGKPAPDLCFHAARRMGCAPEDCLVIEDSEMGVRAAQAAGMKVWHFTGGDHVRQGYRLPDDLRPDRVIADMAALSRALDAWA